MNIKLPLVIITLVLGIAFTLFTIAGLLLTYKAEHGTNQKLFILGRDPNPLPDGFYKGFVNSSISKDWQGKKFDTSSSVGVNIFKSQDKEIAAFPFKTHSGSGFKDKNLQTLKIDYNVTQNPFWVKMILDEIVETQQGKYLGKIHLRFIPLLPFTLGYFRLEAASPQSLPSPDYQIVLLGDSMTERLGNSDELMSYLKKYYPNKVFLLLNYGYGSTNILSVEERLHKDTYYGRIFQPILNIDFNLILIESFGHNPLSQYPLQQGLQKQIQALDKIVLDIKKARPKAKISFVATIAPNARHYGEGVVDLTTQKRKEWANERKTYIKNHIDYARTHSIPLINIYEKSLDENGDGNTDYISADDYIHPSPKGIYFISETVADAIYENNLLGIQ